MDNPIALYICGVFVYWHGIVMALAVATSIACAVFIRKVKKESVAEILTAVLIGFIPALVCGRIFYCYFAQESYSSFSQMLRISDGGTALYGAAFGFLLAVGTYCAIKKVDFVNLLDTIAPSAAAGIFIGRLASYFSNDDIGREVTAEALQRFPFAVYAEAKGEWSLAVFTFEAIAALIIFAFLLSLILLEKQKRVTMKKGDTALMFALLYGITQTMFESMRIDSLFMLSLGFVRISQVISILLATFAFVIFAVRSAKKGLNWKHLAGWIICLGGIALAFWMEFCMTAANAVRNHTVMAICLTVYLIVGMVQFFDRRDNKMRES